MLIRPASRLLCGAALAATQPAFAQTTSETPPVASTGTANESATGGDIIVTAQKRAERLQDVPVAITAVSAEKLLDKGVTDTTNLTQVSPSLTYTQGSNPSNSTFRIRGIGTQVFGQGGESSVSTVIDGVVMARQAQGFTDLGDIQRIEVLRGPQGTLFGKNATGGVINIVTADPSQVLTGRINASIAEKGEYHVNGSISAPINQIFAFRVSGFYNKDDGYLQNVVLNHKVNGYESYGFSGKLSADLGRLNLLASASYDHYTGTCCQSVFIRSDSAALNTLMKPVVAGPNNTQVGSNLDVLTRTTSEIYSLKGTFDVSDKAQITSISAYQHYYFFNNQDVDNINTSPPIFAGGNGAAPFYAAFDINGGPVNLRQFSQELRIGSTGQNRFNYTVGGYYERLHLYRAFTRETVLCPTANPLNRGLAIGAPCVAPVGAAGHHHAVLDSEQYAAFANFDYNLVGGLKLLAGLRAQHQSMQVTGAQDATSPIPGDLPAFSGPTLTSGTSKGSDSVVTYKVGAQYEFNRHAQIYATYGTGYKGQSIGTEYNQTFNNNPVVQPETVKAVELGFKGSTADRKLTVALAVFDAKYRNLQVQANKSDSSTGTILFVTTNAGHAETKGVELEATLRPDDHFSVSIGAAYTYARFDANGLACPLQYQAAFVTIPVGGTQPVNSCFKQIASNGTTSGAQQNVRNGILPNTPAWKINVNPHYERPVGGGLDGFVDLNLAFQSKVNFALEQDPITVQPAYATVDLAIGVRPQDKGFSASIFVKNLTNQRYYTSIAHAFEATAATATPNNLSGFLPKGAFRYVGASLGYKF